MAVLLEDIARAFISQSIIQNVQKLNPRHLGKHDIRQRKRE